MADTKVIVLPMDDQQWQKLGIKEDGASLFTAMVVVEGEILNFMDGKGEVTLNYVVSRLEWPEAIVMMAIGGLVERGVLAARRHNKFILLTEKKSN